MKFAKLYLYKGKSLFLKFCLVVGVFTVIQHTYSYGQKELNTTQNHLKCSVLVNPSYSDKIKCSTVSLLQASKKITKELDKI